MKPLALLLAALALSGCMRGVDPYCAAGIGVAVVATVAGSATPEAHAADAADLCAGAADARP